MPAPQLHRQAAESFTLAMLREFGAFWGLYFLIGDYHFDVEFVSLSYKTASMSGGGPSASPYLQGRPAKISAWPKPLEGMYRLGSGT